jgi:hypothetical protein
MDFSGYCGGDGAPPSIAKTNERSSNNWRAPRRRRRTRVCAWDGGRARCNLPQFQDASALALHSVLDKTVIR